MRPPPDVRGRGRASSDNNDGSSTFSLPAAPQMTYFLADEASIGNPSSAQPSTSPSSFYRSKDHHHHNPHHHYQNRKFTAPPPPPPPDVEHHSNRARNVHQPPHRDLDKGKAPVENQGIQSNVEDDLTFHSKSPLPPSLSPLLPILSGFPASYSSSALSSISSRRNSLSESFSDAGLSVDSHDHQFSEPEHLESSELEINNSIDTMQDSGSAPQLVMPSIKMPSRRPFTSEGKAMGRLKVLVAGDGGVGKTSLIKAIVQSCEHIVHVDSITPDGLSLGSSTLSMKRGKDRNGGTKQITEIYASTKPYPEWWSEVDDLMVLKRRKSLGDAILDRNLCFVDTPGCGVSAMDTITPVTDYIQAHLNRISSNELGDGDVLNMLGGEGGVQVDVVFYMVTNRLRPVDIHYLRQIAPLTNIMLLLAQADLMSADQIMTSKEQIYSQLKEANIRLFTFSIPSSNYTNASDPEKQGVYAISSATGSDHENMDASLLMSPDYVQPLHDSELEMLVNQVFSNNGASWLRHSAARKYVQWRKGESQVARNSPGRPLSMVNSLTHNPYLPPQNRVLTPPMGPTSSYALARITDHAQREERLSQVRLANWAADLQKSLAKEQAHYAALARGERAIWLTERIDECVKDGTLVPVSNPQQGRGRRSSSNLGLQPGANSQRDLVRRGQQQQQEQQRQVQFFFNPKDTQGSKQQQQHQSHEDPLGLLEVAADLRHKGLIALEVLGSLSVLGGLAIWMSRNYVWHCQAAGWVVGEWEKVWCGAR
ncbi:Septin-1 [Podospora fimiseda]|uniref:Septin-1 n=1 Tax=Podospora fimiseda TaxID=252190 RepID=A0AAN6YPD8_9PEZI|nr:Septin-1 [Podospora fimiseda]